MIIKVDLNIYPNSVIFCLNSLARVERRSIAFLTIVHFGSNNWTFLHPGLINCMKDAESANLAYNISHKTAQLLPSYIDSEMVLIFVKSDLSFIKRWEWILSLIKSTIQVSTTLATICYGYFKNHLGRHFCWYFQRLSRTL